MTSKTLMTLRHRAELTNDLHLSLICHHSSPNLLPSCKMVNVFFYLHLTRAYFLALCIKHIIYTNYLMQIPRIIFDVRVEWMDLMIFVNLCDIH